MLEAHLIAREDCGSPEVEGRKALLVWARRARRAASEPWQQSNDRQLGQKISARQRRFILIDRERTPPSPKCYRFNMGRALIMRTAFGPASDSIAKRRMR